MKGRILGSIAVLMTLSTGAFAEAPAGYYPELEGHDIDTFRTMLTATIDDADMLPYSSTAYDTHDAVDELDEVTGAEERVHLIYSDTKAEKVDWPGYNREHVWPQSLGAGPGSPAHVDMHHIFSCDANVNSARGNQPFGECEEDCKSHPEAPEAFYNGDVFEPPVEQKGDIARALFYMDLRYEGRNGEPDLMLTNREVSSGCNCMGSLDTLLLWHEEDPVDEREQLRNDEIFGIQGNRNPFVDHPEWVVLIHGPSQQAVEEEIAETVEEEEVPALEEEVAQETEVEAEEEVEDIETELDEAVRSRRGTQVVVAQPETLYVRPERNKDGYIVERNAGMGIGGRATSRGPVILVGDTNENLEMTGVLSFKLTQLPEGAQVTKAVLHVTQVLDDTEADIYGELGALRVELARGFFGDSAELESKDFEDDIAVVEVGFNETEVSNGETMPVELNSDGFRYLKKDLWAQFRLRFDMPTNEDGKRNAIGIAAGEYDNLLMHPMLEIEYTLPEGQ